MALIDGVLVTPQRRIANPKGDVLHAMKRSGPGFAGFGEAYFSTVHQGDVKGWKRHRRMTLNLIVPQGRIRFVIYDDRPESFTSGRFEELQAGPDNYVRLTVPPGLWMAFQGLDASNLLLNIASEEHDPTEADAAEIGAFPFSW